MPSIVCLLFLPFLGDIISSFEYIEKDSLKIPCDVTNFTKQRIKLEDFKGSEISD